jgi:hypothetical protein
MRPEDLDDSRPPRAERDMLEKVRNRGRRLRRRRMAMRGALGALFAVGLVSGAVALGTHGTPRPTVAVQPSTTLPTATTTVPAHVSYPYLYPFSSPAAAQAWQDSAAGQQPWHLDAGLTAKSFADFLGYSDADQVISTRTDGSDAHVALGFHNPNGQPVVAAQVHLVRAGDGDNAPWEVVGNDQSPTFTLTAPSYGDMLASPVRVAGTITGVDENIRVTVHQQSSNTALGEFCCLPAGGENSPWETTVSFTNATEPVLVISASTGGHIQQVERFAFTAIRSTG